MLYPTELLGHISKIFNFSAQTDSNELPLRRDALYPAELQAQKKASGEMFRRISLIFLEKRKDLIILRSNRERRAQKSLRSCRNWPSIPQQNPAHA